jgi:hypothetical protein
VRNFIAAAGLAALTLAAAAVAVGAPTPTPKPTPTATPTATPTPTPTPVQVEELSADQIMINAEKATRAHLHPYFITYQMHELFDHHWQREEYDYRVWYRGDGKGLMQNISKDRNGRAETYFGYPFPSAPDNDILLYATPDPQLTPPPTSTPGPLPSGHTPPPVLTVQPVVGDRYYSVKLIGIEDYNGKPVYHLAMHALHDERAHPFKDLWVDTTTFDVWRAHAHASGSKGPGTGTLDALVEFEKVGPYWLIAHAIGDGEVHVGPFGDSGHYEYTFHDFGFPPDIPSWYFDKNEFKHHH